MEESHGKKAKQPVAANSQGKKKNGTPVQQLQGTEFCQQTGSLGKDPKLQMRTQSWPAPWFSPGRDWIKNLDNIYPDAGLWDQKFMLF